MNHPHSPKWVVAGIDGSRAAINAAKWAASEAVSRNLPLRLVHAIPEKQADAPVADESLDIQYAETALRAACAAVDTPGEHVKIETDLVHGSPKNVLIDESRHAAMICLGSIGIGQVARRVLGSTADSVAQHAHCPVAVIRTDREGGHPNLGSIAVVVNDLPDNDAVLESAFLEARLRNAPILAMGTWRLGVGEIPYHQLNHRLGRWAAQYPEVHVQPAAARHGIAEFLTSTQESIQLVVVGSTDANKVARMVGPITRQFGNAGRSVLVVRAGRENRPG